MIIHSAFVFWQVTGKLSKIPDGKFSDHSVMGYIWQCGPKFSVCIIKVQILYAFLW